MEGNKVPIFSPVHPFLRPHALTVLCHMHFITPGALPSTHTHTATPKYLCTRLKLIFKFHIHDINELHNKRQTRIKDSFPKVEEDKPPRSSRFLMSSLQHYCHQNAASSVCTELACHVGLERIFHLLLAQTGNATPTGHERNVLNLHLQTFDRRLQRTTTSCSNMNRLFLCLFSGAQVSYRMVRFREESSRRMAHIIPITQM